MKMPKFGTKNALFWYFWTGIWRWYCRIWNQHLRICLICKISRKKCPNLGPKMPFFGIFDQKCLIWVFLDKNFKKDFCHIWNQHPWICIIAKFLEETKMPKFGTKNALFGYFWTKIIKKTIVIFEISTLEFV